MDAENCLVVVDRLEGQTKNQRVYSTEDFLFASPACPAPVSRISNSLALSLAMNPCIGWPEEDPPVAAFVGRTHLLPRFRETLEWDPLVRPLNWDTATVNKFSGLMVSAKNNYFFRIKGPVVLLGFISL